MGSATGTSPVPNNNWMIPNQGGAVVWPNTQTLTFPAPASAEKYANEVEVDEGEHDATLRFYRKRGSGKTLIQEVTVPLGVLELLREKPKASRRKR